MVNGNSLERKPTLDYPFKGLTVFVNFPKKKKTGRNSANNGDKNISDVKLKNSRHSCSCVDR